MAIVGKAVQPVSLNIGLQGVHGWRSVLQIFLSLSSDVCTMRMNGGGPRPSGGAASALVGVSRSAMLCTCKDMRPDIFLSQQDGDIGDRDGYCPGDRRSAMRHRWRLPPNVAGHREVAVRGHPTEAILSSSAMQFGSSSSSTLKNFAMRAGPTTIPRPAKWLW